jgi:hypothetical protein
MPCGQKVCGRQVTFPSVFCEHWLPVLVSTKGPYRARSKGPKTAEPKDISWNAAIETNTQHDLDLKGDVGKQHQRRTFLITSTGRKHSFAASSQFIKWTDNY